MDKNDDKNEIRGLIYSIQRYCIHDGPGIRTTVFFKGCQLTCPWCANPESQSTAREIGCQTDKCTACGYCAVACTRGAIDLTDPQRVDRNLCDFCGDCTRACLRDAWKIYGEQYTVDALVEQIEKDMPFYRKSGGGVTFSGGEPTMQPQFLLAVGKRCKAAGIHTAMETHGYASEKVFSDLAAYTDLFMIDVKHMDSDVHERMIGVPTARIHNNIRMLAGELKKKVSLRVPLVPGFNDDEPSLSAIAAFASEIGETGNLTAVNILPYHAMGSGKYALLGREYTMANVAPPSDEAAAAAVKLFADAGLPAILGG